MFIVTINDEECSGCDACTESCPARILSFVDEKAVVTGDESECMGCESCIVVCPTGAISIMEI